MKIKKYNVPKIDLPQPGDKTSTVGYTGFNSLNLQEIYVVEKQPAIRSQIARGWGKPIIVRLSNGNLLASQFKDIRFGKNPQYPEAEEETALCKSTDDGISWSKPRLLGLPGRPVQFSALKYGTLILACDNGKMYRSEDAGETWMLCEVAWEGFLEDKREGVHCSYGETNGVLEMLDGELLCSCYTVKVPIERYDDFKSYIIRSHDGGKTWGDATFIVNTDEVSYILLPDNTLLGFARVDTSYVRDIWGISGQKGEGGDTVTIIESKDGGRKWTKPNPIGLGMAQIPGFPILLKDGRLLLIYGNRQFPFGSQVIASRDNGKTWDLKHPIILSWFSWDNYGGHPRSLVMPDGSILTGYYARVFKEHVENVNKDIVSHVVRWDVPNDWPPKI